MPARPSKSPPRTPAESSNAVTASVDAYIAAQPEPVQAALRRLRSILRAALPDAEEVISYKIPAYKLHGRIAIYFAGWKSHYALYLASGDLVSAFQDELAPYEISKGTIRFPLDQPVPAELITRLARFRAAQLNTAPPPKSASRKKLSAR